MDLNGAVVVLSKLGAIISDRVKQAVRNGSNGIIALQFETVPGIYMVNTDNQNINEDSWKLVSYMQPIQL